MKIKNIDFNNIPNKLGTGISTKIVQSNIGNLSREEYIASENFYKLYSAIDIDWNGAVIDEETEINDTADLIAIIKFLKTELKRITDELNKKPEGTIETEYTSNQNGDVQLINPGEDDAIQTEFDTDQNGDVQVINTDNE